jgi:O-acetyl-ADP-ribose deacetylase (regulator of RNase III)
MKVDSIVNAANSNLLKGGGVCGAIFNAAGSELLQEECDLIGKCETGEAVITKGYNLLADYVIHAVGPIWRGGNNNEEQLLKSCYYNSLRIAKDNKLSSIAFPLISSGIYGYPKHKALKVAVSVIGEFLLENDMMVYLVVFDRDAVKLSEKLFISINKYIDEKYVEEKNETDKYRIIQEYEIEESKLESVAHNEFHAKASDKRKRKLEDVVEQLEETFSQMLLRLIDEKGKTDVETYKKANIDRKLFSKIRGDKEYKPRKATVIAFAIALELNVDETKDLLSRAGYALTRSRKFDVIVEYFIEEKKYDIHEINEALFAFKQPLLGL